MKGRKSDAAGLQDFKGNPGKRKSKAERQLEEANRLAELLATAPIDGDPLMPPAMLTSDPRLAPAKAVWLENAPRLSAQNMLEPQYRLLFCCFCIYAFDFITANEDILKKGYSIMVKTISGDRMPRENPSVARRDQAMKYMMDLSTNYGFTPLDHYKLIREMGQVLPAGGAGDLFGKRRQAGDQETEEGGSAIGTMDSFDSEPPPDSRPN